MNRLADALKIRPGEGRLAALLIGLMLFSAAGSSIGGTAIDALFFARFGVEFLPYMYVALGLVTFLNLMVVTGLLGQVARERLYVLLPLLLAALLVGERLILALNVRAFYPAMWLSREVVNAVQGLVTWGIAAAVCDTRQAKRLFPLFTAGSIFGGLVGAFGTPFLVSWLHSENLLLAWALALIVAAGLGHALIRRSGEKSRPGRRVPGQQRAGRLHPLRGMFDEMRQGYQYVRRSPLMRWMSAMAVLFSVLWFSLLLPFSRAATAQFPDADALASFLATFNGAYTAAALLASLFFANRLFARFGLMPMMLMYPVIYLVDFTVLAFYSVFPALVVARFVQLVWSQGIADTVWHASLNAVPPGRRDQTRAFLNGVPGQAGIVIAGLILVIGEQALAPQQLYLIGWVAAALTIFAIWRAKRAYGGALVDALRVGQPQMFLEEEEPFGGFQRDAAAVSAAIAGMSNPDPAVRRVSAEVLGHLSLPEATEALARGLRDAEPKVRAASLRALASAQATSAVNEIAARVSDPDTHVRAEAVEAIRQLAPDPETVATYLRNSLLLNDISRAVRARAAVALVRAVADPQAWETLKDMAAGPDAEARVQVLEALGEMEAAGAFELIVSALNDVYAPPVVRRTAAAALVQYGREPQAAIAPLVGALGDESRSVREAAAAALGQVGAPALDATLAALADPAREGGALLALRQLPVQHAAEAVRHYARAQAARAVYYHDLVTGLDRALDGAGDVNRLLADSLRDRAQRHAVNALRAVSLLGDTEAMGVAIENLRSRDPNQRANALETLETIGDAEIIPPVLEVWEASVSAPRREPAEDDHLLRVMQDPDAWLRACAALAGANSPDSRVRASLEYLAQSDPDLFVRATAASASKGAIAVDTIPTLSPMERILFLRRVPLFADLSPADLKQVAAVASEQFFPDGEVLFRQGEPGAEMFIVVSGEVRVVVSDEGKSEEEVARRKAGEYVGEMAIISQEPRMASLVASGDVRTLCIDQKHFEGILRERPETSLAVMRVLCARLREK